MTSTQTQRRRVLIAGDVSRSSYLQAVARSLLAEAPAHGLAVTSAVTGLGSQEGAAHARRSQSTMSETMNRISALSPSRPDVILGFGALHAAIASYCHASTPWVVFCESESTVMPPMPLGSAARRPGLFEVATAVMQHASAVVTSSPRIGVRVARHWHVAPDRVQLWRGSSVGSLFDLLRFANNAPVGGTAFHFWLDLWRLGAADGGAVDETGQPVSRNRGETRLLPAGSDHAAQRARSGIAR